MNRIKPQMRSQHGFLDFTEATPYVMSSGFKRRLSLCKTKYENRQKTDETVGAIEQLMA